ncbi:MAG: hypothetical protein STSR0009_31780 [Methanoregula sp.]
MTHNKQNDRTGGSFRIIPERRSGGVAGLSHTVPGGDAFASGTANDCDVNNHEPDVEFLRTAQRLIERDADTVDTALLQVERNAAVSGADDARQLKNPEQGMDTRKKVPQRIEQVAYDAINSGQLKNTEQEVKIKDMVPRQVERDASGADDAREYNNHERKKKTPDTPLGRVERNASASGAIDSEQLKNPEPEVKIKDTAPHLIERDADVSGAGDNCPLNNHERDANTVDTAPLQGELNAAVSGAVDARQLKNPEPEVKIKDTPPHLIERNASAPGAADAGQLKSPEPEVKIKDTPPRLVERATGLRGRSICSARVSKSTYRKQTERDLNFPDADVPYIKTEHAIRALVCSLMERQDRVTEAIFLKLNDLEYRVDNLELCKPSRATKQSGTKKEAGD